MRNFSKSTNSESRQQNQVHRNDRMILRFKRNRKGIETWDDWFVIESEIENSVLHNK